MQTERSVGKNQLLALALSAVVATTAGCGGGGDGGASPDVSEAQLKQGVLSGMTGGPTGNFSAAVTQVVTKSQALQELQTEGQGLVSLPGNLPTLPFSARAAIRASDGNGGFGSGASDNESIQELANFIDAIIEKSTVTQNGNTYTIDPNESEICTPPDVPLEDVNKCTTFLGQMTMTVTVNATSGDQVTAATTDFRYANSVFLQTDFTPTTAYFEIRLDGTKTLLVGYNQVADAEDKVDIAAVMTGSVRFAIDAPSEQQGTLTLSIPDTVVLRDDTEGMDMTIAATNKLLSLSADATTETAELEVGLGALNVLFSDEDDFGNSFPVHLTLDAISGKMTVNETQLQVTGFTLDSIKLDVDGQTALQMALAPLSVLLEADAQNRAVVTLDSALDFSLDTTNVRSYLDDDFGSAPTDTLKVRAAAPTGAILSEVDDFNDVVKLTGAGPLTLTVEENGVSAVDLTMTADSCANFSAEPPAITACPVSQ